MKGLFFYLSAARILSCSKKYLMLFIRIFFKERSRDLFKKISAKQIWV